MIKQKFKEILREMVEYKCEDCGKHEDEVGELQAHRIIRGSKGGKYIPRNIKMLCLKHHQLYHSNEFSRVKAK